MAKGYLGEFAVDIKDTPFKDFDREQWVLYFIEQWGQIDGGHHKQWVLDQIARILTGTPVVVKEARWTGVAREYRVSLDEPSHGYRAWVEEQRGDWNEAEQEYTYDYDPGSPP